MIKVIEQNHGINESYDIVFRRFHQIVSGSKQDSIFKIGLTNWPKRRKYGHRFPRWVENPEFVSEFGLNPSDCKQSQPWKEMHVIFESRELEAARTMEAELISPCLAEASYAGRTCWNLVGGGGGPRSNPGPKNSYYVYVLLG